MPIAYSWTTSFPNYETQASLDYVALGATVAVKNQGKCGSCWVHATTAVVEGRLKIDTGNTTSLSEQYLMDCDTTRVCNGCCGGLPERTLNGLQIQLVQELQVSSNIHMKVKWNRPYY